MCEGLCAGRSQEAESMLWVPMCRTIAGDRSMCVLKLRLGLSWGSLGGSFSIRARGGVVAEEENCRVWLEPATRSCLNAACRRLF